MAHKVVWERLACVSVLLIVIMARIVSTCDGNLIRSKIVLLGVFWWHNCFGANGVIV